MRISDWSSDVCSSDLAVRQDWRASQQRSREPGGREFPSPQAIAHILDDLKGVLFPMRLGPLDLRQESENFYVGHTLDSALHALLGQARLEMRYQLRHEQHNENHIERSEEHTSELQSLMRISYAVFCLKKKRNNT